MGTDVDQPSDRDVEGRAGVESVESHTTGPYRRRVGPTVWPTGRPYLDKGTRSGRQHEQAAVSVLFSVGLRRNGPEHRNMHTIDDAASGRLQS